MLSTYPIDFSRIDKGSVITAEEIEDAMGVDRSDVRRYQLAVLKLRGLVEKELEAGRQLVVTCKQDGDSLRVLTDEEASEYNPVHYEGGLRKMGRAYRRNMHVDIGKLSERKKGIHERNIIVEGRILQAVKDERKRLRLEGVKRPTPGKDED